MSRLPQAWILFFFIEIVKIIKLEMPTVGAIPKSNENIVETEGQSILWEEFEDTKGSYQNLYIEEEQTTQWPKEKEPSLNPPFFIQMHVTNQESERS
jgi:aconitase A